MAGSMSRPTSNHSDTGPQSLCSVTRGSFSREITRGKWREESAPLSRVTCHVSQAVCGGWPVDRAPAQLRAHHLPGPRSGRQRPGGARQWEHAMEGEQLSIFWNFPVSKVNLTNICLPVKHDTINIVYCVWLQAVASYQCLPGFYNYGYGKL